MKTAIFSLIIAISVAGLSLLQFDKYQKLAQTTHSTLSQLEQKLDSDLGHFNSDLEKIKTQEQTLLNRTANPSFQMAEIEYLISLAHTRLQANRDLKASIQLLNLAQEKILAQNDPMLYAIQEALGVDVLALQKISLPNPEELWLGVSILIEQLPHLAPRNPAETLSASKPTIEKIAAPSSTPPTTLFASWKKNFFDSLESLKDLVKIRHTQEPIESVLSETQQVLVQENLRLLLEQLRFAVLNSEEKIYQAALQEAQKNLLRYYQDSDPAVQQMQQRLQELAAISLRPDLPQITALKLLKPLR